MRRRSEASTRGIGWDESGELWFSVAAQSDVALVTAERRSGTAPQPLEPGEVLE